MNMQYLWIDNVHNDVIAAVLLLVAIEMYDYRRESF